MFRSICAVILTIAASYAVLAQGGSNYSMFGVGDIRRSASAAYDGLGGTQIGVASPYAINLLNPAAWSALQTSRLQIGFRFNQQTVSDGSTSADQNNGKLDGFCLAFSIDTALGASAVFGLRPFSSVNYSLATHFSDSLLGKRIDGSVESTGSGGLTSVFLGGAIRPVGSLRIGASVEGLFGTIISTVRTTVFDANAYASINQRNDGFKGMGGRFGAMYSPWTNFAVGISASAYSHIGINSQTRLSTVSTDEITSDTLIASNTNTPMPASLGIGLSYVSGKFLFAADAETQDFSIMTYRKGRADLKRMTRFSAGVSRLAVHDPGSSFENRIGFNFGLGYQQLYYSLYDKGIDEIYGSFGMQLPVSQSAMLDMAITGGSHGSATNGAVRELFLRFGFSASIGEIWFQPFVRE